MHTVTDGVETDTIHFTTAETVDHEMYKVISSISNYDLKRVQCWPPTHKPISMTTVRSFLKRMQVLIYTTPLTGIVVAVRYGNIVYNKRPLTPLDYTVLAPMVTMASFIMGTVLNNVMSDYKESEKIPAEILAYFHNVLMFARTEAAVHGYDPKPMLREIESMLLSFMAHLDSQNTDFSEPVKCFNNSFLELSKIAMHEAHMSGKHCELGELQHCVTELTKKWARINDIARTSIILPGYTILDLLTFLILGLLISVEYPKGYGTEVTTGYWACGIFASIVIYINLLARELDDPFNFPKGHHFETYVNGGPINSSFSSSFKGSCNIDFEPLFAGFGSELRELLYKPATVSAIGAKEVENITTKPLSKD